MPYDGVTAGSDRMLNPTPELPDDTPIGEVELSTRIRNVLEAAGLKTVGEVREISDEILLSFNDCGKIPSRIFVRLWVFRRRRASGRGKKIRKRVIVLGQRTGPVCPSPQ